MDSFTTYNLEGTIIHENHTLGSSATCALEYTMDVIFRSFAIHVQSVLPLELSLQSLKIPWQEIPGDIRGVLSHF
jgi:hypothetical protein